MTTKQDKRLGYVVLTLPSILIYAAVIIFPVLFSFALGFTEWGGYGAPESNPFGYRVGM